MAKKMMIPMAAALCLGVAVACLLPSPATAGRVVKTKFMVEGKVLCDTCRVGYQTPLSTPVPGAMVKVVCKTGKNEFCSYDGVTDSSGTYNIWVEKEHHHDLCQSVLVSNPDHKCATIVPGRETAPVLLTTHNANSLLFMVDSAMAECEPLIEMA